MPLVPPVTSARLFRSLSIFAVFTRDHLIADLLHHCRALRTGLQRWPVL
jgi:hypothetical protein